MSIDNLQFQLAHHITNPKFATTFSTIKPKKIMLPSASCLPWASVDPVNFDFIVTASGTPFPCSKSVLIANSGYFSTQLALPQSYPNNSSISLPTVPADVFRSLLGCIYSGKLNCTTETVYQLFWYAQMLQIPGAILQCTQFLSSKLTTAEISHPTPSSPPNREQPLVIKPIARPGVPLLSLPSSLGGPSLLRPHLASFYSDWFMRYSALTRINREKTAGSEARQGQEMKENQGK